VTTDSELEIWQQEWRDRTEPLPEWKRKIERQNVCTAVAGSVIAVSLALSTLCAVIVRSSFAAGLAVGMGVATVVIGGYGWWVRRGAWKPSAQTTLAYMELAHRRAVAKARQLRFSFYFLLATILVLAAFVAWREKALPWGEVAITVAVGIELVFLHRWRRRKQREAEETQKLIIQMRG
jgi:Flp pilus assembly protein TadB